MARVVQFLGGSIANLTFGVTRYFPFANGWFDCSALSDTETPAQITYRTAGVLSYLTVFVSAQTWNGDTIVTSRVNGSDGNQTFTIGTGATGTFSDTSHTDAVAVGDEVCGEVDWTASSSGTGNMRTASVAWAASGTTTCHNACVGNGTVSTASQTRYEPFAGRMSYSNTTLANAQQTIGHDGTEKNGLVTVHAGQNSRGTDTTFSNVIDGTPGSILVTVGGGATGIFEDTSNSDALSVGDLVCKTHVTGTGSGSVGCRLFSTEVETSDKTFTCGYGRPGTALSVSAGTTRYVPVCGAAQAETTESVTASRCKIPLRASYLHAYVSANSVTVNDSTVTLRKEESDTALLVTFGAEATGVMVDSSNTVDISADEDINLELTAGHTGAESIVFRNFAIKLLNLEPATDVIVDMIGHGVIPFARAA